MNEQVRQQRMKKLKQIRDNQIMAGAGNQPVHMPQNMMPPPVYPGGMVAGPGMTMTNYGPMRKQQQFQALQQHHLQQQRRLQFMRMQQQQQQQVMYETRVGMGWWETKVGMGWGETRVGMRWCETRVV